MAANLQSVRTLCHGCLSADRELSPIAEFSDMFNMICAKRTRVPGLKYTSLCWECTATLKRMQAFHKQVNNVQTSLKSYIRSKDSLKALHSLSNLSLSSTKTDYDENFVYCMKQETVESEDDFQIEVKFDTQELIAKAENIDTQDSYLTEDPDKESLYVTVEPLTGSGDGGDGDGYDSEEWPLSEVKDKKVIQKNESDIKTEPKKHKIEQKGKKLTKKKEKDNFTIKIMTFKEMHRLREEDRKRSRYLSAPFKCATCISGFPVKDKYNCHVLKYHSADLGPHTCDICLARHKTAELVSRHRETHLYRYHCRECSFNSHKLQWMLVHQTEHKKETFSCQICGFSTFTVGRLRYHRRKMHKKRPTCQICSKEFTSGDSLKKHMLMKHGTVKLEKCTICGGMYRFLRIHLRSHAPSPPAPDAYCVECGVSFKNEYTLKNHLSTHSKHRQQNGGDSLRYHACDECGYRSMYKADMDRHKVAQHTKQYPFNCDICHKGFNRRDRLKVHVLERHEGGEIPRKKMCSYCGKAFKTKAVLNNHIRIHTGERPFQCPHCPWSFAQRITLRMHMRGQHPGVVTGNTGGTAGSSNTRDGGKRAKAARKSSD